MKKTVIAWSILGVVAVAAIGMVWVTGQNTRADILEQGNVPTLNTPTTHKTTTSTTPTATSTPKTFPTMTPTPTATAATTSSSSTTY